MALDVSYSLALNEQFAMSVTSRYFRSDLGQFELGNSRNTINSVSFDIGAHYQGEFINSFRFRHGAVLSNLGPKVKYNDQQHPYFIPIQLKLGSSLEFNMGDENVILAALEFGKLLVPTLLEDQINSNLIQGIFQSFSDAPGGGREELNEISYSLGMEYQFKSKFSLRTGYFRQSPTKGYQNFFSLGTGFQNDFFKMDLSYLINVSSFQNQLRNTFRISLSFPIQIQTKEEDEPQEENSEIESEAVEITALQK